MNIPTTSECLELLKKYEVPENLIRHSIAVNKVAMHIAKKIKKKGKNVNLKLVNAASLLHDIAKLKAANLKKEPLHCEMAEEILSKEGYPEVGHVAKMHKISLAEQLETWEEKIVYYADKRVRGNRLVSIKERYADLEKRYNIPHEKKFPIEPILKVEETIFRNLDFLPEVLDVIL